MNNDKTQAVKNYRDKLHNDWKNANTEVYVLKKQIDTVDYIIDMLERKET